MEHKTTHLILLLLAPILLFCASPALAQSPAYLLLFLISRARPALYLTQTPHFSPSDQMPPEWSQMCQGMMQRSDEFDSMLYSLGGVGGALDPQRISWTLIDSFLASDFIWQDYSPVLTAPSPETQRCNTFLTPPPHSVPLEG